MYSDILEAAPATRGKKTFQLARKATGGAAGGKGGKGGGRKGPVELPVAAPPAPKTLKVVMAEAPLLRELRSNAPQAPYRRRKGEVKTTLHWNERKLLLYETEFLARFAKNEPATVVYLCPSPGLHIQLLSKMFPKVSFYLVDDQAPQCKESKRIRLIQSKLSTSLLKELNARFCQRTANLLLISNLKSSKTWSKKEDPEADNWTGEDLQKQMEFVRVFSTLSAALLKFRLPYAEGATEFAKGEVMLPVWGGQTSTETRIVVEPPFEITRYDHKTYEERLFHYNTITRLQTYAEYHPGRSNMPHHIMPVEGVGFDYRYDATAEIGILLKYIATMGTRYFLKKISDEKREKRRAKKAKALKEEKKKGAAEQRKRKRTPSEESASDDDAIPAEHPLAAVLEKAKAHEKAPDEISAGDRSLLARHLSEDLSAVLSKGWHTLATQPFTYLHEPRSAEEPYNQRLRSEFSPNPTLPGVPVAGNINRTYFPPPKQADEPAEKEAENAASSDKKKQDDDKQQVDAAIAALGIDLGDLSDSSDSSSVHVAASSVSSSDSSGTEASTRRRQSRKKRKVAPPASESTQAPVPAPAPAAAAVLPFAGSSAVDGYLDSVQREQDREAYAQEQLLQQKRRRDSAQPNKAPRRFGRHRSVSAPSDSE